MEGHKEFPASYLDYSGRDDMLSGGARMIPIQTPKGSFNVWTKRIGNHPTMKVLLLHGGPGESHEYLESFDSFFPSAGIEYYYYDQLHLNFSCLAFNRESKYEQILSHDQLYSREPECANQDAG
jgi:hypothetical protein